MIKRVAVLLDGGFVLKRLSGASGRGPVTSAEIIAFARRCVQVEEELFRIYYYDCPPFSGRLRHPMTEMTQDYSASSVHMAKTKLLDELAHSDFVALREGVLSVGGWKLGNSAQRDILKNPRLCTPEDFVPEFTQKRVDMKIGLDVAWLASKRIVDRIILVTADTDFVPAMKFARREGVQVVLVPMRTSRLNKALRAHADEVRDIPLCEALTPPAPASAPPSDA